MVLLAEPSLGGGQCLLSFRPIATLEPRGCSLYHQLWNRTKEASLRLLSPGSSAATVGTSSPPTAPLSPDKDRDREGLDDKVELLSKRCSKLASLFDGALFKTSVLGTRLAELELGAERCECGQRARKDTAAQETGRAAGTPDSQRRERAYDRGPSLASITNDVSTLLDNRISELRSSVTTIFTSSLLRLPLVGHLLVLPFLTPQRPQQPTELGSAAEALAQSHQDPPKSLEQNKFHSPPSFPPLKANFPTELNFDKAPPPPYQPVITEVWDEKLKVAEIIEFIAITVMPAYSSWSFEELRLVQISTSDFRDTQVLPFSSSLSWNSPPSGPTLFDLFKSTRLARPLSGTAIVPFRPQTVYERAFIGSAWTTYAVENVSITSMPSYSAWSFEELRLADYPEQRRYSRHTFRTFSAGPTFAELLQRPPPAFVLPNDFSIFTSRPHKQHFHFLPTPTEL